MPSCAHLDVQGEQLFISVLIVSTGNVSLEMGKNCNVVTRKIGVWLLQKIDHKNRGRNLETHLRVDWMFGKKILITKPDLFLNLRCRFLLVMSTFFLCLIDRLTD